MKDAVLVLKQNYWWKIVVILHIFAYKNNNFNQRLPLTKKVKNKIKITDKVFLEENEYGKNLFKYSNHNIVEIHVANMLYLIYAIISQAFKHSIFF